MPKTTISYRIFIASPSDVSEEKSIIKSVAEELNSLNLIKNIKLEVIDWQTSTHPGIGEDAQDVINNQINDEYDIFIGLFWHKFGTATKREVSGTKEEFERAYSRHLKNPNNIKVLMYFKDSPVPISEIDAKQIEHIQEFRKDISNRGVLFSKFTQSDEFEKIVRSHLSQVLNEISNEIEQQVNSRPNENALIVLEKSNIQEEELGYFEYIDIATEAMYQVTSEIGKITKQTLDLEKRMVNKTKKMNSINTLPDSVKAKESRKLLDGSANDLDIFSRNVTPIIPVMNEVFNKSMNNFNKAILIHKSYLNEQGLLASLEGLKGLKIGITSAYNETSNLRDTIKTFPPLTNRLLKSRNEAVNVLTHITNEFQTYINITDNIINVIVNE